MEYIDFSAGFEAAEDAGEGAHQSQHFVQPTVSALQDPSKGQYFNPNMQAGISCDVKPRLTKEQHDILEAHYSKQPKPNTNIKKGFAETLNVSLEKVNNWFQNRRAKTKQDAKKAANALNLFQAGQQSFNSNSDSESSPYQTSPQYAAMMQQWSAEEQNGNGLGISHMQQSRGSTQFPAHAFQNGSATTDEFDNFEWPSHTLQVPYNTQPDLNRRTLTQETFDAMSRNGGMMDEFGQFETFQAGFSGNQDILNQVFPNLSSQDFKQQDVNFPYPIGAPLSSSDSTVPSMVSDQSIQFPASTSMQNRANMSTTSSDWADSRSSSLSALQQEHMMSQMSAPQSQNIATTSSQWQPGQSVPLDVDEMKKDFRQAAQARTSQDQQPCEQPLAFPADEAFTRRNSQASALAHSMGNFGIGTPLANQSAVFKSPAPPASIAARRQRPRPANLVSTAMRSQSYSGVGQPGSPGHVQQQSHLTSDQQLRRIRSSIAMSGAVAQGRVMKSTPGSAQRSPLNRTFNDALNSPNFIRTVSQGNLAPPTPLSPSEFPRPEQPQYYSTYQRSGHVRRQPSINEIDFETNGLPYHPSVSVPAHSFSSPPHTPMYYDHPFVAQRIGSNVITENTPPQSAPAGQTCFPSNLFSNESRPLHQQPLQPQVHMQQPMRPSVSQQSHQFANTMASDHNLQMPNVTFAPNQQANVTTGPPPGIPLQFANVVPIVNAEGNIKMSFPPQVHLLQQQSQQMQSPPQAGYAFVTSGTGSPSLHATAQSSAQPKPELFVHEYSPPEAIRRAATPRKPIDTGVKSYTFTNAGPENFEEKKGKKSDAKDSVHSTSPASSNGSSSTY